MNSDKELNEIGKKVFEELKKQSEGLDKNKKTLSYVMDEESHVLHQERPLQENIKKTLGKLRSENIEFGMEIIKSKKNN